MVSKTASVGGRIEWVVYLEDVPIVVAPIRDHARGACVTRCLCDKIPQTIDTRSLQLTSRCSLGAGQ